MIEQTSSSGQNAAAYPVWNESPGCTIELFEYPEAPWTENMEEWSHAFSRVDVFTEKLANDRAGGQGGRRTDGNDAGHTGRAVTPDLELASLHEEWAGRMAAESRKAEERGYSQGLELGLSQGREEAMKQLASERDRLHEQGVALAQSFAEERSRYFHQIEQETVRLALAIAARILRREAQMDPLLLTGAVRVALGQLAQSTSVKLHVPVQDQPFWEEALARIPGLALRPRVIAEPDMKLGECRMETELGSADLGLWAQLKEVESGFFDRVGARMRNISGARDEDRAGFREEILADRETEGIRAAIMDNPASRVETRSAETVHAARGESQVDGTIFGEKEAQAADMFGRDW